MTIKRRLFWSNILMIVVPALSAVFVGVLCIALLWFSLLSGAGLPRTEQPHFTRTGIVVAEAVEHALEYNTDFAQVEALLRSNGLALQIRSEDAQVYAYGSAEDADAALIAAAELLGGAATLSKNGRSLYACRLQENGASYSVYLLGGTTHAATGLDLKVALLLSLLAVAATVLLAIFLTNRFLTKFVFRAIEEPLDILTGGVHEIRDGNLAYRIAYAGRDEFSAVCADFNEMAAQLQHSVELTQRQEQSRKALIAGISHDIRSPLTSIQAYVEGLLDGVAKTPAAQRRRSTPTRCRSTASSRTSSKTA